MRPDTRLRSQSGLLVRIPVILLLLVSGTALTWVGNSRVSSVLLLLGFAGLAVRFWGQLSARHVSVSVRADRTAVFPGTDVHLFYSIQNDKLLPLIWLELTQPLPDPIPLTPEAREELRPLSGPELAPFEVSEDANLFPQPPTHSLAAEKRFAMLGGYRTVEFETRWHAVHRGVFRLDEATAATGDGLGLTQNEWRLKLENTETVTVYPQPVPVRTDLFLKNLWMAENSSLGNQEDLTVIRSTRDYLPADPAKRINWRLTAKGMPLITNVYETILPRRAFFVFDAESFNGPEPDTDALEDCISVLTGLLLALNRQGVGCILAMPKTEQLQEAVLSETGDMLQYLAAYRFRPCVYTGEGSERKVVARRSVFASARVTEEARKAGRVYYVCRNADQVQNPILRHLEEPVFLSYYGTSVGSSAAEVVQLTALKGGSKNG